MKQTFTKIALCLSALAFAGNVSAQTTILSEDFETGALPTGWSQVTLATDGGWKFGLNTVLQSQNFPITAHTKIACTNDDNCNCNKSNDILSISTLDLSTYTNVFLSYDCYYYNLSYQGITEEAKIVASTDGGVTWSDVTTLTANTGAWQTNFANLTAFAGNSNVQVGFKYNDGGGWLYGWAIDNVLIYEPVAGLDAAVASVLVGKNDPTPTFVGYPKYLETLPLQVVADVTNQGTVVINSFDYSWTDGTNTYNQSFSGLTLGPLEHYIFTATNPYVTLGGSKTITGTISNINTGATELSTTNNAGTFDVEGVVANPDKKFFAEEATGTWCQWCPRGAVFMKYMTETYPDKFVGVAVHNADPMTVPVYDQGIGTFITGYPSVLTNRTTVIDPSQIEGDFLDNISTAPPVVISGYAWLNVANNILTVNVTGNFSQNLSGDIRFNVVVVEDSVHGTTSPYNQVNTYAGGANGPMGGFEALANPVPAAQMYYDFVGRALGSGFTGAAGSLPGTIASGSSYSYQFNVTAATTWNQNRLSVAALVIDNGSGAVLNVNTIPVQLTSTGIAEESNVSSVSVYPSPANDVINLSLNMKNSDNVNVTVTDALGKVVLNQNLGTITSGIKEMQWNVTSLPSGVYQLSVQTDHSLITNKFLKE